MEGSSTSMLWWAVFAQPRTPCGYSIAHEPTTAKQACPTLKSNSPGDRSRPTNVTTTRAFTSQSVSFSNVANLHFNRWKGEINCRGNSRLHVLTWFGESCSAED